jgi:hypothetical protein
LLSRHGAVSRRNGMPVRRVGAVDPPQWSRELDDSKHDDDSMTLDEPASRVETPKVRRCLMCHEPFGSEWSGERLCKRCKTSAQWRSGI